MPHPFIDTDILKDIHADRFRRDAVLLHQMVNRPDSAAVRAEVAVMLRAVAADPPQRRPHQASVTTRLRAWAPRWFGWLRAMPLP